MVFKKFIDRISGQPDPDDSAEFMPRPPGSPEEAPGVDADPITPGGSKAGGQGKPPAESTWSRNSQRLSKGASPRDIEANVDDTVYRMRAERIQQIESMFGEFGSSICSYILTQSLMPGGLKRVVMKLEISSRGRDGADLAQICHWIEAHGAKAFCEKVGLRVAGNQSVTPSKEVPKAGLAPNPIKVRPIGQTDNQAKTPPISSVSKQSSGKTDTQKLREGNLRQQVMLKPVNLSGSGETPRMDEPAAGSPAPPPGASAQKGFMFSPRKIDPPRPRNDEAPD